MFLDGKYAFGITRANAETLQIGMKLTSSDIDRLKEKDQENRILSAALKSLSYRPKSENELQKKLEQKGFDPEQITPVMDRLKQHRLINDNDFSAMWVENQTNFRPRGKRLLSLELRKKGVGEENIADSLKDLDEERAAFECAARYARRLQGLDWKTFRAKLGGHLSRRGFGYDLTSQVIRKLWQEIQISDEDQPL